MTVTVHERYTIVNCLFLAKYKHIFCQIEYGQDCIHLSSSKGAAATNESDVTLLLFNTSANCFVVTATNGTYNVEVHGNFTGGRAYSVSITLCYYKMHMYTCRVYSNTQFHFNWYPCFSSMCIDCVTGIHGDSQRMCGYMLQKGTQVKEATA